MYNTSKEFKSKSVQSSCYAIPYTYSTLKDQLSIESGSTHTDVHVCVHVHSISYGWHIMYIMQEEYTENCIKVNSRIVDIWGQCVTTAITQSLSGSGYAHLLAGS